MQQRTLAKWLKAVIIGSGLCGLVIYFLVFPIFGQSIVDSAPEFAGWYRPWLVFLWVSGIPCYAVLVFAWRIAANIQADRSFTAANAAHLKWISWLAAGDAAYFFVGNVAMLLLNMSHPGVTLLSLIVVFIGIAVSVAAAALSHLVQKAAVLQEQSDLTI